MEIDVSGLEMEERTIGLPKKPVPEAGREEARKVVEVEIDSDITDLELQERTIGVAPTKVAPAPPAVKAKKIETDSKKSGGCCIALLTLGASGALALWGISKMI